MTRRCATLALGAVALLVGTASRPGPAGESYADLVRLFEEWRVLQRPALSEGVPDYTPAALERQRRGLVTLRARLSSIDCSKWPVPQQVDYHLVRAEMNGLDFDHRVLRPWARDPGFYAVLHDSQSDTPAHEGHVQAGAIELWQYAFPLPPDRVAALRTELRAIPRILAQAKANLVVEARDLWRLGARVKQQEAEQLASLERTLAQHHPELVPDATRARQAVDDFRVWLETKQQGMTAPSGVGIADYDWYLRNVHLSPYTWKTERALHEREWARATAQLVLLEGANAGLPPLEPAASAEGYKRRFAEAVGEYMRFLGERGVLSVKDYMEGALRAREGRFVAPERRDFFDQVEHRDALVMRCHGFHWFDLARIQREPHPSPIRRGALLYNIWDSRAEGMATAMEEMMMTAGLFDRRPRARELVSILVANRAARGLAGLRQHSRELSFDQALQAAHEGTPRGWLLRDGDTNWFEQKLYLQQPGYSSCYLSGKAQIERLIADRARQLGDRFRLQQVMDEIDAAGLIPVSLLRWEITGLDDEVKSLLR